MTHWTERHRVIPAVYILLRRADTVLCIRRANTGYQDGHYGLPAGHLDGGEPAIVAMVREAKEEVDVTVRTTDLRLVHVMHRVAEEGTHERMDLYFETTKWTGEPRNMEPHKCDDLQWYSIDNLPKKMVPVVRSALKHIAKGEPYSDYGF